MRKKKLPKLLLLTSLAFLIVNLIWGAAGPVIKYTLDYLPPFTFLFLRFLIVGILLLPYSVYELAKVKVSPKDYLNLLILGLFSQTSIVLIFVALKYTSALDSTVIGVLGGALTIYAGHYFYKEKVSKGLSIGVGLAIIGTLLTVFEPLFAVQGGELVNKIPTGERLIGNFLALLYSLTWVLYVIWSKMSMGQESKLLKKTLSFIHLKPMTKNYSPMLIVVVSMYVGLLSTIPFFIMESFGLFGATTVDFFAIDPRGVAGLLFMAVLSSIVAYILNQWALAYGRVSDSVIWGYLSPVFAFPVAYLLLGETPSKFLIICSAIVALGVLIAEISQNIRKEPRKSH